MIPTYYSFERFFRTAAFILFHLANPFFFYSILRTPMRCFSTNPHPVKLFSIAFLSFLSLLCFFFLWRQNTIISLPRKSKIFRSFWSFEFAKIGIFKYWNRCIWCVIYLWCERGSSADHQNGSFWKTFFKNGNFSRWRVSWLKLRFFFNFYSIWNVIFFIFCVCFCKMP